MHVFRPYSMIYTKNIVRWKDRKKLYSRHHQSTPSYNFVPIPQTRGKEKMNHKEELEKEAIEDAERENSLEYHILCHGYNFG